MERVGNYNFATKHVAGSSQPQHFFAAGCVFADFAITLIFYSVIKLYIICVLPHSIIKFESKINIANMLKIFQTSGTLTV